MTAEGHKVAQLSGALEGYARDEVIDQFRSGRAKVLITTNVLARGIDVQSVTMVINYVSFFSSHIKAYSSIITFVAILAENQIQGHTGGWRSSGPGNIPSSDRADRAIRADRGCYKFRSR